MKLIIKYSDYVGITAGGLCVLHCLATPILFLSQATVISAANEIPFVWQSIHFFFLLISFFAIYYSAQNSSNSAINFLLLSTWLLLSSLILIEVFEIFYVSELYTYIAAISLCILHIYNLKYCRCRDNRCCIDRD